MNINFVLYPLSEDYKRIYLEKPKQIEEYINKTEGLSSLENSSKDEKDFRETQMIFEMDDI